MSEYTARITWERAGEAFIDNCFSRRHAWTFDGGVTVQASSSPDILPEPMSDATAIDPEEALVAALSSCHMLWFLTIAAAKKYLVESYRDEPVGIMEPIDGRRQAITRVTLRPEVRFGAGSSPTREELEALHRKAKENCFIANSLKAEVVCSPVFHEQQTGRP
jgi:organic hydroperoxide reductase OsmC/OhrA